VKCLFFLKEKRKISDSKTTKRQKGIKDTQKLVFIYKYRHLRYIDQNHKWVVFRETSANKINTKKACGS
jgi:hypothetical protein